MSKFHIGKNGPAPCKANKGKCPLGGESGGDNHFDTISEAEKAFEKQQGGSTPPSLNKNIENFNSDSIKAFKNGDVKKIAELYPEASEKFEGGEYYIVPTTVDEEEAFLGDFAVEDDLPPTEDIDNYEEILSLRTQLYDSNSGDGYDVTNGLVAAKDLNESQSKFLESGKKVAEKINVEGAVAIDTNKINDDWSEDGKLSDYEKLIQNIKESEVRVTDMFGDDSVLEDTTTLLFTKDRIITL